MRALRSRYAAVATAVVILGSASLASAGQAAMIQPGATSNDAQATGDLLEPRWLTWLGCWELVGDAVDYRQTESTGRRVVCVNPRPDGRGVTMITHLDGAVVGRDNVLADGQAHPTQDSGCEGWQRSLWPTRADCSSASPTPRMTRLGAAQSWLPSPRAWCRRWPSLHGSGWPTAKDWSYRNGTARSRWMESGLSR